MINIRFNEEIITELMNSLETMKHSRNESVLIGGMNLSTQIQILKNQIELSKQLQEIEEKLPRKHSAFQPG